ncbi:hypothetical protein GCM10018966_012530 [Streptomyces yanii]
MKSKLEKLYKEKKMKKIKTETGKSLARNGRNTNQNHGLSTGAPATGRAVPPPPPPLPPPPPPSPSPPQHLTPRPQQNTDPSERITSEQARATHMDTHTAPPTRPNSRVKRLPSTVRLPPIQRLTRPPPNTMPPPPESDLPTQINPLTNRTDYNAPATHIPLQLLPNPPNVHTLHTSWPPDPHHYYRVAHTPRAPQKQPSQMHVLT